VPSRNEAFVPFALQIAPGRRAARGRRSASSRIAGSPRGAADCAPRACARSAPLMAPQPGSALVAVEDPDASIVAAAVGAEPTRASPSTTRCRHLSGSQCALDLASSAIVATSPAPCSHAHTSHGPGQRALHKPV